MKKMYDNEFVPAKEFKRAIKDHLIKQQFAYVYMPVDDVDHGCVMYTMVNKYYKSVSTDPEVTSYYESSWKLNTTTGKIDVMNTKISKEEYDEAFNAVYCRTYDKRSDEFNEELKATINICRFYQYGLCPAGHKHPERYSMEYKRMYKLVGNTIEFILKDARLK